MRAIVGNFHTIKGWRVSQKLLKFHLIFLTSCARRKNDDDVVVVIVLEAHLFSVSAVTVSI